MHRPAFDVLDKQCDFCEPKCPHSLFGSGSNKRGQACQVQTFLFLLNPDFGDPPIACLQLSPSSIKALKGNRRMPGYLDKVKNWAPPNRKRAQYYELVWTKVSSRRVDENYCVAEFNPV